MRRSLIVAFVGVCGIFVGPAHSAISQSASESERAYELRGQLFDDGKLIGAPHILLRANQPAIITVDQDRGYSLKAIAREGDASAKSGRRLVVETDVYLRRGGQWARVAAPRFTIPIGKLASFELDASGRTDRATDYPFKMEITVTDATLTAQRKLGFLANACSEKKTALWQSKMANRPLLIHAQLPQMLPPRDDCCKSGNLTCCGGPQTCCSDGVSGNGCCVP